MFYEPGKTDHNLPHDPFKACVIPRPIGWISTISPTAAGQSPVYNLAPYSQFNNLTFDPPYVMFSANQTIPPSQYAASAHNGDSSTNQTKADETQRSPGWHRKDTVHNAESTGYFCWQLATYDLRDVVNRSAQSLPYNVDEFEHCGIDKAWSEILPIKIPMVKDSPVRFECQYFTTLRLPGNPPFGTVDVVIGRVLGIHISDSVLTEGKLDVTKTKPIARCGYYDYAVVDKTFEMIIPGDKAQLGGLEGSTKWNRGFGDRGLTRMQSQDAAIPSVDGKDVVEEEGDR